MKVYPLLLFISLLSLPAYAQVQLWPKVQGVPADARVTADTLELELPFFDDFYQHNSQPDAQKWLTGGVELSQQLAIAPPSLGVASFNGANAQREPYTSNNFFTTGIADTLLSHRFDLSERTTADQLLLSFYVQPKGRGELPDEADSLLLQVLTANGQWQRVWAAAPADYADTTFTKVEVAIQAPAFLHSAMQFRFLNYARLSGPYDTWLLDYVLFYSAVTDNAFARADVAFTSSSALSKLAGYSAIPLAHFKQEPGYFLSDSLRASINNLADTFAVVSPQLLVEERYSRSATAELPLTIALPNGQRVENTAIIRAQEQIELIAENPIESLVSNFPQADSLRFRYTFLTDSIEQNTLIQTSVNDTLRFDQVLHNYYAYDDGSAEFGAGSSQAFAQVAVRYFAPVTDTLTHIDFHFLQVGQDAAGLPVNISIWSALDTALEPEKEQALLYRQSEIYRYSGDNSFVRFKLNTPLVVEGFYYIGYEQTSEVPLVIGWDTNSDNTDQLLVNTANLWEAADPLLKGTPMVRPVFAEKSATVLSVERSASKALYQPFPNPATDIVHINGSPRAIKLYSTQGRLVKEKINHSHQSLFSVDISDIKAGIYFLQVDTDFGVVAYRLLRQK